MTVVTSSAIELGGAAYDPNQFVGVKGQVKSLSDKVSPADNEPDKVLKVFSIVGFGGLGKTTLALQVCRELEEKFHCQATVPVSQAFDASKDMCDLLKGVLRQVVKVKMDTHKGVQQEAAVGNVDSMTEATLITKLADHLKDKRYLIVLDDVWTIPAWDAIRHILPENNNNSRIIVTTRIEGVAKACSPPSAGKENIHKIEPLKSQDAEKLFVDRVFGINTKCPDELKDKMSIILKKCGGLPLAIVSIASLLASYRSPRSIEMWERICNSMGSQLEINPTLEGMRQIITLSYSHLPHHLKTCMMYLSIFPEDCVIRKKRILYRWVAEGLVMEKRGLTLLEVAEANFDELISRNMIDPTNIRYDGAISACRVHDMMLEVIVSRSLEENFVTLVGGQCGGMTPHDRVRRLSIQGDDPWQSMKGMDVQHIRSLSTFRDGHHKLLDRLAEFTLLRVLDLEGCKDIRDKHMKSICGLFLLRFLSLRSTDVTQLPSQIENLQHLQTLDLMSTAIEELPLSVTNLEKLEHLYFRNKNSWTTLWRLPKGLEKMKSLRLARKVSLYDDDLQVAHEIGKLTQLRDIEFVIGCNSEQVLEALAYSLSRIQSLRTLKVADLEDTKRMNFLLQLPKAPPHLQSLRIAGLIDRLPSWIESLKHLATVKLSWLYIDAEQIFSVLHKLPNLMRIDIGPRACKDSELVARATYKFHALKDLRVTPSSGDNLEAIRFEEGSMEILEKLAVRFSSMSSRLEGLEHLKRLRELKLMGTKSNKEEMVATKVKVESEMRAEPDQVKVIVQYE